MDEETRKAFDSMVDSVDALKGEIVTLRDDMVKEFESLRADMLTKEDLKLFED